ncbi:hypothetical protein [Paenibacillus lutimineralis]|uniref:hypothetical protein n=1 Tax=Paenibacillus lutimineralis TaxID=2707005 RepID=UPI001876A5FA|nr:hypothetical protein [Paenibacillus lutimineralis]
MLRLDRLLQVQVLKERFELEFAMDMDAVNTHYTPRRKPFVACVILANPRTGESWYGYRIVARNELEYEVEFYDTEAFLQHLLTTPWVSLKSPKWLRQKLMVRCQQTIERLLVSLKPHFNMKVFLSVYLKGIIPLVKFRWQLFGKVFSIRPSK